MMMLCCGKRQSLSGQYTRFRIQGWFVGMESGDSGIQGIIGVVYRGLSARAS